MSKNTDNPAIGSSWEDVRAELFTPEEIAESDRRVAQITDNPAIGSSWEDFEREVFTPEEIAESDLRVALIGELIKARQEKGISQKKLEELSGVRQPVIARMERGDTNPQLETVLKVLAPLGKTLAIVPLRKEDGEQGLA